MSVFVALVLGGAWLVAFVVMQRTEVLSCAQDENHLLAGRLAEAADRLAEAQRRIVNGPAPHERAAWSLQHEGCDPP